MVQKKNKNHPSWLIKAYDNPDFLHSAPARPIRVLAELIEPVSRLKKHKLYDTVVFFGSARTLPRDTALKNLRGLEKKIRETGSAPAKLRSALANARRELVMSRYYEDALKLSGKLTRWFDLPEHSGRRFIVCSGGGPGIMEAANRGAQKAGGQSIGLNISLPLEQYPNIHQTKELSFEFHYFFIRKFWFFYPAKALIVFPGGYGTLDELFELLTLVQTKKTQKYMPIILYGRKYWKEVLNFDAMIKWGAISKSDLDLFKIFDNVDAAFEYLKTELTAHYLIKPKRT
ncbi:MAG: LOG family protein [Candidatus Omnitrophota bacterium]